MITGLIRKSLLYIFRTKDRLRVIVIDCVYSQTWYRKAKENGFN